MHESGLHDWVVPAGTNGAHAGSPVATTVGCGKDLLRIPGKDMPEAWLGTSLGPTSEDWMVPGPGHK